MSPKERIECHILNRSNSGVMEHIPAFQGHGVPVHERAPIQTRIQGNSVSPIYLTSCFLVYGWKREKTHTEKTHPDMGKLMQTLQKRILTSTPVDKTQDLHVQQNDLRATAYLSSAFIFSKNQTHELLSSNLM